MWNGTGEWFTLSFLLFFRNQISTKLRLQMKIAWTISSFWIVMAQTNRTRIHIIIFLFFSYLWLFLASHLFLFLFFALFCTQFTIILNLTCERKTIDNSTPDRICGRAGKDINKGKIADQVVVSVCMSV